MAALVAVAVGGCDDDSSSSAAGDPSVTAVATTTQVGDLVREVGGDRVDVHQILGPDDDPHDYEPRPGDAREVAGADVVFQSGSTLDDWLDGLVADGRSGAPRVELIQAVEAIPGGERDDRRRGRGEHDGEEVHDHGESADPHWWQDPRNAIAAVTAIRDALIAADPDGRAGYEDRAGAYAERLRRLDREVAACIERIPPAARRLATAHDALGYYADRYGLEPAAAAPRGDRPGPALWDDALGPAGSDGATYVESIEANTAALVDALTGGAQQCRPRA